MSNNVITDLAVAEIADSKADPKLAVFAMPEKVEIEGFVFYPFAAMRKAILEITGNEIINAYKHCEQFKQDPAWEAKLDLTAAKAEWKTAQEKASAITDQAESEKALQEAENVFDGSREWLVMTEAVPEFAYQLTALAFVCVTPASTLSKLSKDREKFREAVFSWWEPLDNVVWQKLTIRAWQELIESNIGNDYKIKPEEKGHGVGVPQSPN